MTPGFHSSPQFPQFTTVHHVNCEHCPHHTTTVVAVGCGECVVEVWRHLLDDYTVHSSPHSTVKGGRLEQ